MLETFTLATFADRLGEPFTVNRPDGDGFQTSLVEATSLGPPGPPTGRAPFALVFHGPVLVPQGIFRMTHAEIGDFELFLVPIGPDEGGVRYEAVFT